MKNLLPLSLSACLAFPLNAAVLLQDDFNDNSLDPALWNVVTAGIPPTPSATEQNQQMEILRRAHLNTASDFDPDVLGGIIVTGTVEFVDGTDFLQILTRSDGTPSGGFGETANGLEFFLNVNGGAVSPVIRGRGGISVGASVLGPTIDILAGDIFDFTIVDEGASGLSFTIDKVGGTPFTSTTTSVLTGDSVTPSLVTFHNREGGDRQINLDDVTISSIPEPSSVSLGIIALCLGALSRKRA